MAKKLIIVGKAASGKDYLKGYLERSGFSVGIADTTRPIRKGEAHGREYNFIRKYQFLDRLKKHYYVETGYFNAWYYGTPNSEWRSKQVFIMTPLAIAQLSKEDRAKCRVVYLDLPESIRHKRLSARNDADSVERRLHSDEKDFSGFKDYDLRITREKFNPKRVIYWFLRPTLINRLRAIF